MEEQHITMRDLPDSERPYEKFMCAGANILSDAELLAVILRNGGKGATALQLAQKVLCQGQKSLLNLEHMEAEDFMRISGIGKVKAIQLKCIAELSRRMSKAVYEKKLVVEEPSTVAYYYMERLRHEMKEMLMLVMFDARNRLLGDEIISVGTVNSSLVSPREIFLKALGKQAVNIILLHNHPSGDPSPSEDDMRVTLRVAECGDMLGIQLADHIIIGDNRYTSLREKGIL